MSTNLIIKSSFSILPNGELKSNFGDLIRSTVLLECIGSDFLWLTDSRSVNLLKWFVDVKKIITYEDCNPDNLEITCDTEIFNLDNYVLSKGLFAQLRGNWHGYIWDGENNVFAENNLIMAIEPYKKAYHKVYWQEALIEGMGFTWYGQDYAYSQVHEKITTDVGLNYQVHKDWTSKQWSRKHWEELEMVLKKTNSVSWQKGLDDFDSYVSWLSSCRLIVTCDTLGLHLASALRKKVVTLVGATENMEFPYNRVTFLKPVQRDCMPCNVPVCKKGTNCLHEIDAKTVCDTIMEIV